jgi:hypothetical protein
LRTFQFPPEHGNDPPQRFLCREVALPSGRGL